MVGKSGLCSFFLLLLLLLLPYFVVGHVVDRRLSILTTYCCYVAQKQCERCTSWCCFVTEWCFRFALEQKVRRLRYRCL